MIDSVAKPPIPSHAVEVRRTALGRWLVVPKAPGAQVDGTGFSLSGVLDGVLDGRRAYKAKRYEQLTHDPNYKGPRIVAEGDSWFEYPFSKDLIMQLGTKYAVLSLAKAGDAWADIIKENELFPTVEHEHPDIVMLSIGGNEVMGQIEHFVREWDPQRGRDQYIRPTFATALGDIEIHYINTVRPLAAKGIHVILHGYDYPDPRTPQTDGAQWIGPPLEIDLHIDDESLWRQISMMMLDEFNARLRAVAAKPEFNGHVHYVNLLGTIGSTNYNHAPDAANWHDEIHASDAGFATLAGKLATKIDEITAIA